MSLALEQGQNAMKSRSGGVWDMYHAARPSSRRNLNVALERLVGKPNLVAKRAIMANAIVAQMLPDGSIKGGSAIKMRLSDGATRFTTDLDVARDRPWMTSPSSLPGLWRLGGRTSRERWSRRGRRIPETFPRNT